MAVKHRNRRIQKQKPRAVAVDMMERTGISMFTGKRVKKVRRTPKLAQPSEAATRSTIKRALRRKK